MKYIECRLYMEWCSGSELFSFWLYLKVHQWSQVDQIIWCNRINLNQYLHMLLSFEGLVKEKSPYYSEVGEF